MIRSFAFRPLVICVRPLLLLPSVTTRRANWLAFVCTYTKGWFSVSRSTAASGTVMASGMAPAPTSVVTNMSRFNFFPGFWVTMRACRVRVVGSSAGAI